MGIEKTNKGKPLPSPVLTNVVSDFLGEQGVNGLGFD